MIKSQHLPHPLNQPTKIAHYHIVRKLGQGGMSVVYEAIDERLKRSVAVKVLHPFLAEKPEYRSRFLREALAVARLTHPNIVQIFDVSSSDENTILYIVTELLIGRTLKDFYHDLPLIELPELSAMLMWEIADALDHAHQRGIIHRDLKPENIIICANGHIKLMDFGIASIGSEESLTQAGTVLGSLAHVAPEIIRGDKISIAADIFSLSTVFYWLLTGKLPFNADSPHALLKAIVDSEPEQVQCLSPFVSDDIAMVVERGMKKNPEERFKTTREFCIEIEQALNNLGVDVDVKSMHHVLQNPQEKFTSFKESITTMMQKKIELFTAQQDQAHALALQCRLDAIVQHQTDNVIKPKRYRRNVFASCALMLVATILCVPLVIMHEDVDHEIITAKEIDETSEIPSQHWTKIPFTTTTLISSNDASETIPPPPEEQLPLTKNSEKKIITSPTRIPTPHKIAAQENVEIIVWPFATIIVDGEEKGRDVKSLRLALDPGKHTLIFVHPYAATVEKTIKVTARENLQEVRISLDKSKPAFLVVKSSINADIAIDGSYKGSTTDSLRRPIVIPMPDKTHAQKKEIIVSEQKHSPVILETELVAGQTKYVEVTLKPKP